MTLHLLTIETHGICTHFTHGVVSGVPHRIVLPNATHIQSQTIAVGDQAPILYYLVPHFAQFEVPGGPDLTIPLVLQHGDVLTGVRLQVINCHDQQLEYVNFNAPGLTDFDPDYTISDDVVLQGRAACYFDIYGGAVAYQPPPETNPNGAGFVRIEMQTDGPPELLVTPLVQWSGQSQQAYRMTLGESPAVTLKIRNVELARVLLADEKAGAYDFLLHYLTARGGIPESIDQKTPGMPAGELTSVQPAQMAEALRELASAVATANTHAEKRELRPENFLTSSCAPSAYP